MSPTELASRADLGSAATEVLRVPMPRLFTCELRVAASPGGWFFGFLLEGPAEDYGHAEVDAKITKTPALAFQTRAGAIGGALVIARLFFDRPGTPGRQKALGAINRWATENNFT
jgi:hypothetical protein